MNYPSIARLKRGLNIDTQTAEQVRKFMITYSGEGALKRADKLIDGSMGIEYLAADEDQDDMFHLHGVSYLNFGDTFTTTLTYDHETRRFLVTDWGSIVERNPERFSN